MTKFNELQSNFSSGEVSPKFYGRRDLKELATGAQLLNNFIPRGEGGFSKRGGTEFIADITTLATASGKGPALIPFISKKDEGYVLAINAEGNLWAVDAWIWAYRNDGAAVNVLPLVTVTSLPPVDLDPKGYNYSQIGDVIWITHSSGRFRPVVVRLDLSAGVPTFFVSDYDTDNLGVASDPNYGKVSSALRQPYRDRNISTIQIAVAATSGTGITMTSSAALYDIGHVGAYFKARHGATEGVCKVVGFTNNQQVTVDIIVPFGATSGTDNWAESAWSYYRGFPRTVAAFEQRLVWGGSILDPDTVWFSRVGNPFMMMQERLIQDFAGDSSGLNYFIPAGIPDAQKVYSGVGAQILEDDPFSIGLSSTEANPISWMSSGRDLALGTLGAEYIISGNGGLSILTVSVRKQTNYGGAPRRAVRTTNEVLYLVRNGQSLRSFKFNETNGSYISANVSLLGEHMRKVGNPSIFSEYSTAQEFLDLALQQGRDIIWAINSKNQLIGLNYSKENNNVGWFRTQFPNPSYPVTGLDSCQIWGVTAIPSEDGENDDLWLVVERENSGGTIFCLERINIEFDGDSLDEDLFITENIPLFLDSSKVVDNSAGAALSVITGLAHLNGHTVTVVYRGEVLETNVVAAGQITLSAGSTTKTDGIPGTLMVGIPYTAEFESLDLDAGLNIGTSEGQIQRIDRVYYRFYNSKNAKAGSITRQDTVKFRLSDAQALSSESIRVDIPNSPDIGNRTKLVSEDPFPCTVLSMAMRGNTYD